MNNNQERTGYSEEISLVDLAATFVRRRWVFYVTFVAVVLVGLVYALLLPAKYEYVTLLQSAEKADGEYIEEPVSIVATLRNRWIPEVASTYAQINKKNLPFLIKPSNPEDTGLVRIGSEAAVEEAALVEKSHKTLVENVLQRQERLLNSYRESLESQIKSLNGTIEALRTVGNSESTGAALVAAIQKRAEVEGSIDALRPAEILVVTRQSTEQKGTGKVLVVALAVILGGMMGVFLAFAAEFLSQVRARLRGSEAAIAE